jgi:hypothetical protein
MYLFCYVCYPCRYHLFGFDGAKVRRFLHLGKHFCKIVCANGNLVDMGQIIVFYLIFYGFLLKLAVIS